MARKPARNFFRSLLGLWVERERRQAEILAAVDAAQASIDRGEGIELTQQSMPGLAEDVKRRGGSALRPSTKLRRGDGASPRTAGPRRTGDIWDYITNASRNAAVADRVIDFITDRFRQYPHQATPRTLTLTLGARKRIGLAASHRPVRNGLTSSAPGNCFRWIGNIGSAGAILVMDRLRALLHGGPHRKSDRRKR